MNQEDLKQVYLTLCLFIRDTSGWTPKEMKESIPIPGIKFPLTSVNETSILLDKIESNIHDKEWIQRVNQDLEDLVDVLM